MKEPIVYTDKDMEYQEAKIRFLEQCLDNKEKVNKSLREENKKLKEKLEKQLGEMLFDVRNH